MIQHEQGKTISAPVMGSYVEAVFNRCGLSAEDATIAADSLVTANLRGVDTHGIRLLPIYVKRLRMGLINPKPSIRVAKETASTLLIDGENGLGQVVGTKAMRLCVQKAKDLGGIACVGVRRSNHFGAAAYFAMQALAEDMIGLATSNGSAAMAPWGAKEAYFGNNPLALAVPAGEEEPVIFDMATAFSARARIRLMAQRGEMIPEGWALDSTGHPTTDARAAMTGVLLPLGGAKGYGLALMCEVLAAVLTGAGFGRATGDIYEDLIHPQGIGHFFAAVPVSGFMPVQEFHARMDEMIRQLKSLPAVQGIDRVRIPGERSQAVGKERTQSGIPLPGTVLAELKAIGEELGVPVGF